MLRILRNGNRPKEVIAIMTGDRARGPDLWGRVVSIEGDRDRRILGTQVSLPPVRLLGSQIRGLIALSKQDRARVRGPLILSLEGTIVSRDLQYPGADCVVDCIPDSAVWVRMLVILVGRLVT